MRKYSTYKDSGVEWIGEIPSDWNIGCLKLFCDNITDGSHHSPPTVERGKRYISVKDIGQNEILFDGCKQISDEEFELLERNGCRPEKGDILLTKDGTIGRAAIVGDDNDFVALSSLGIIRPNKERFNSFFLRESLVSSLNVNQMFSLIQGSALTRITISIIKNLLIVVPPLEEQTQIANYLDQKTTEIDTLITKKEQLIKLLEEERTAMINQAVTKGLDSDVPLKDSGIDWLGKIPEHWEVKRLKHIVREPLKYGANEAAEQENKNDPRYIRITDFGYDGNLRDNTFKSLPIGKAQNFLLKEGDILFARSGATVGKTFFFKNYLGSACFAGYLIKASCDNNTMLPDFLYAFTNSNGYENWKQSIFQQATIQNIGADKYNQLKIGVPTIKEQFEITDFIAKQELKISKIINTQKNEITLLKEYKTALISEVVTGKIDVREEVLN